MSNEILNETKSHYTGGLWGKTGDDYFLVTIPPGQEYETEALDKLEATMGSDAVIVDKPPAGQTGTGEIKVHWWYNAFGKIRYNIKSWAREVGPGTTLQEQTLIVYSDPRSHYGELFGDKDDDVIQVNLPGGYSFRQAFPQVLESFSGEVRLVDSPAVGSTGSLTFRTHWWYGIFGKIRYRLKVTASSGAQYQLEVTSVTHTPDPAVAGRPLTVDATVRNSGPSRIDRVRIRATAYAKSLDDVPDAVLSLRSDAERTVTVVDAEYPLDVDPGQTGHLTVPTTVLASFDALGATFSTAGHYRLTVMFFVDTNIQVATHIDDDFEIVKPA